MYALLAQLLKISSAAGVAINDSRTKKMNAFSDLTEQVLYSWKFNSVTLFSFKQNLIMYSITNSKAVAKLQFLGNFR